MSVDIKGGKHNAARGSGDWPMITCILIFAIGILLGAICSPSLRGIISPVEAFGPATENADAQMKPVLRQLVERVRDSTSTFNLLLILFAVVVTFVSGVTGALVLAARLHVKDQAKRNVTKEVQEQLDPRIREALDNLVKTNDDLLTGLLDSIEYSLGNRTDPDWKRRRLAVTARRARNEEVVVDSAQQLSQTGTGDELDILRDALDRWPIGSAARLEIQRAIDAITRRQRPAQGGSGKGATDQKG